MLEALSEIAFAPQFLPTRVEKERKAVLAEAQVREGGAARRFVSQRLATRMAAELAEAAALGTRLAGGPAASAAAL